MVYVGFGRQESTYAGLWNTLVGTCTWHKIYEIILEAIEKYARGRLRTSCPNSPTVTPVEQRSYLNPPASDA